MTNVLLLLNHNFVASPDAEATISSKKLELNATHPGASIDQYLLSNIVLEKVSLTPDHYDFVYYLDSSGFNTTIPNHPAIKASVRSRTNTTVPLNSSTAKTSKVGSKLSKLKFKRLDKSASPTPSLPELVKAPTPIETEKKLRYFSDDSDDDELIDEDELIGTSLNTSSIICLREPNSTGKKRRKACKDCTCGLAEREAFGFGESNEETESQPVAEKPRVQFSAKELTEIDFTIEGKTGGCGSCSLGDAFRCSGCPFLGLPAFQPGQAISLDMVDDDL